ncbi:hypothetical protein U9M48_029054 [Paspalum notatum var. saurae]|uniref:RNase H type-1 domain-containing protein n=1 Tax=Paspalum notatum var. saurae TaxID=547442 RepID=A0AAQ3TY20_PASNO
MQIDTRCPVCGRLDEDGGHCFLKCKYVKHCWAALGLEHVRSCLLEANSANQMVKMILDLDTETKLGSIACLWACWETRNKVNAGEQRRSAEDTARRATLLKVDASLIEKVPKQGNEVKRRQHWKRPPAEQLKINCDGAFIESEKTGGWGFIIRDLRAMGF